MKPVFLDTVGLIALWDPTDQWHAVAAPVFAALLAAHQDIGKQLTASCREVDPASTDEAILRIFQLGTCRLPPEPAF
jgi:hypothetical protein